MFDKYYFIRRVKQLLGFAIGIVFLFYTSKYGFEKYEEHQKYQKYVAHFEDDFEKWKNDPIGIPKEVFTIEPMSEEFKKRSQDFIDEWHNLGLEKEDIGILQDQLLSGIIDPDDERLDGISSNHELFNKLDQLIALPEFEIWKFCLYQKESSNNSEIDDFGYILRYAGVLNICMIAIEISDHNYDQAILNIHRHTSIADFPKFRGVRQIQFSNYFISESVIYTESLLQQDIIPAQRNRLHRILRQCEDLVSDFSSNDIGLIETCIGGIAMQASVRGISLPDNLNLYSPMELINFQLSLTEDPSDDNTLTKLNKMELAQFYKIQDRSHWDHQHSFEKARISIDEVMKKHGLKK